MGMDTITDTVMDMIMIMDMNMDMNMDMAIHTRSLTAMVRSGAVFAYVVYGFSVLNFSISIILKISFYSSHLEKNPFVLAQ